jgi:hypothetical protein
MYEPAAAWTKDFHQPCLHAEQDSPLGACTVTAGAPARDLMANLAGEEEAHRSCCSGSCRGRTSCGRAGRSARTRCRASLLELHLHQRHRNQGRNLGPDRSLCPPTGLAFGPGNHSHLCPGAVAPSRSCRRHAPPHVETSPPPPSSPEKGAPLPLRRNIAGVELVLSAAAKGDGLAPRRSGGV